MSTLKLNMHWNKALHKNECLFNCHTHAPGKNCVHMHILILFHVTIAEGNQTPFILKYYTCLNYKCLNCKKIFINIINVMSNLYHRSCTCFMQYSLVNQTFKTTSSFTKFLQYIVTYKVKQNILITGKRLHNGE